jgi:hypothetical protein
MKIEVEVRAVYGTSKVYPINDAARVVAELAGTSTLTLRALDLARKLGHEIVDVTPAPAILERFKVAA